MRKLLIIFICLLPLVASGQTYAIPNGAYGLGKFTRGAYSSSDTPQILYVDTLIDADYNSTDSTGSLRWALEKDTARVILFEVSGYINLTSGNIDVYNPHFSMYGQTAPSPGITISGDRYINIRTHDFVIQHLRFRAAYDGTEQRDALAIFDAQNGFIDHCSFSYAEDENLGVTGGVTGRIDSVTAQNNIFYQGLTGSNSKGILLGDNTYSFSVIRSAFIHCATRTPASIYDNYEQYEVINTYSYNNAFWGNLLGEGNINSEISMIGNYWKAGTNTSGSREALRIDSDMNIGASIYLNNNYSPTRVGTSEWDGLVSYQDAGMDSTDFKVTNPFTWGETYYYDYSLIEDSLSADAGARNWDRDSVDIIALDDMINGTGAWITAQSEAYYPTLAENTTTLNVPINPNDDSGNGYTNLEMWVADYQGDPCDTTNVTPTAETTPAPNGTITTTTIGGVEPYTYDWSNDSTTKDLTGLDAGTYSVVVTDDNGCTGNGSWTIRSRGVVKFNTGLWIYNGGSVVFE